MTRSKKVFSKEEANKAIIFVERIAQDVVTKWKDILAGNDRIKKQTGESVQVKSTYKDLSETKFLIEDIQYHTMELAQVGCFFKDFNNGVVLFPAEVNGVQGYYVWKTGDMEVSDFYVPQKNYA